MGQLVLSACLPLCLCAFVHDGGQKAQTLVKELHVDQREIGEAGVRG